MSYEIPLFSITRIAGADLTNKQYHAVKIDTGTKDGVVAAGAAEEALGILQHPAIQGEPVRVMIHGVSMAVFGAAVTYGQKLTTDANGALVPVSDTEPVLAIALESGNAGEIHPVLLK